MICKSCKKFNKKCDFLTNSGECYTPKLTARIKAFIGRAFTWLKK